MFWQFYGISDFPPIYQGFGVGSSRALSVYFPVSLFIYRGSI